MRVDRFTDFLTQRLREVVHPGLSTVDTHQVEGVDGPQPAVRCADGSAFYLHIVMSSPSGGEDYSKPERIVEREPGVAILVRQRAESEQR